MMRNIRADFGIINFWWCDDHGAILTAFALQQFLKKEGYSSELLKCSKDYDENKRKGGISELFERQYMKSSSKIYKTYNDIFEPNNNLQLNSDYIGFITGSDQVFRPDYVPDSWYLTFVSGKGKIAASASFGTDEFICNDTARVERISRSLKTFDYLSVREDSGVKICRNKFNIDAYQMIDPVFILEKEIYQEIIHKSKLTEDNDYIFCYIRDLTPDIEKMVDNIKISSKCKVVWCVETMPIEDFLYNISNCRYVITDSYHGMCFSIIFNKDYLCIKNLIRGRARFDSLQKQLGLSDINFISENEDIDKIPQIDYRHINEKLSLLVDEGSKWLKNAVDKTYRKYR